MEVLGDQRQASCGKGMEVTWAKWTAVPQKDIEGNEIVKAVDSLALITSFLFPIRADPSGTGEMERELCNCVGQCPMSAFCVFHDWIAGWLCEFVYV